jgi:hypothetical protein
MDRDWGSCEEATPGNKHLGRVNFLLGLLGFFSRKRKSLALRRKSLFAWFAWLLGVGNGWS